MAQVDKKHDFAVTITGRHMEITPALKSYAEQKATKLAKYYDLIHDIEVVCNAEKAAVEVEMIAKADHHATFVAKHHDGDAYACIDGCMHKLERQITEHKDKHRNRKHTTGE